MGQPIDNLNKQELESKQDTISYSFQEEPYGDKSYVYKIGGGQNVRFIEATQIFAPAWSRAEIKFKNNNGIIFRLYSTCEGYGSMGQALVGQLSWEKPEMIQDFKRCITLIEESKYPCAAPLEDIMSYIRLREEEEVLRKEERERERPIIQYCLNADLENDCFLEITNEEAKREIALYDAKKDLIFSVTSVKNEEDAAKEIVNVLPHHLSLWKEERELCKKIKEKLLAVQGNTFVDKLLQEIQAKEAKEAKNKLATLRKKAAKIADKVIEATGTEKLVQKFTGGKKIADVEISLKKRAFEKKISDKLFSKINE